MQRAIGNDACEVADHYGARNFYANPAGMVGIRSRGMFVWHGWSSTAGGYVVTGSTAKRGWDVTQHRCESGEPKPVRTFRKKPRSR